MGRATKAALRARTNTSPEEGHKGIDSALVSDQQETTDSKCAQARGYSPSNKKGATFPMQALVTLSVLAVALYIILSRQYSEKELNWAFSIVAAFVGFWLRGNR